jgi:hypothetical protein
MERKKKHSRIGLMFNGLHEMRKIVVANTQALVYVHDMKSEKRETVFSLNEQINVVLNLPEAGHHLKSEARIALDRMARETKRHKEEMDTIREQFQIECWNIIEKEWTCEELEEANRSPEI